MQSHVIHDNRTRGAASRFNCLKLCFYALCSMLPYPPFQTALPFTLFTPPLVHPVSLPLSNSPSSFCPCPSFLTSSLILWLLGLYSIQPLLWNQLTNSSPDKLPISCGQRDEEKRDWSSIEPIAVLLNASSEEEGRKTRWGRERGESV